MIIYTISPLYNNIFNNSENLVQWKTAGNVLQFFFLIFRLHL